MTMTSNIPQILLLCQDPAFITAFSNALHNHWPAGANTNPHPQTPPITPDPGSLAHPNPKFTLINSRLNSLPPQTTFDAIVSPANSFARLDGAFDHAISATFSPRDDYHALTRAAQKVLYEKWRGFAPPGTCTLVPFPEELKGNQYGCEWVAICPTMREPGDVNWDREVVYECVWSLLCQVEGWNRRASASGSGSDDGKMIRSVLMTPLAAGVGKVSQERWAAQTVLAMRHFWEAVECPLVWGALQWDKIEKVCDEVAGTWK